MKKSYHSIIVPAVDATITRQTPLGAVSSFAELDMARILEMPRASHNHRQGL
jgi:hypothetical protein